MSQLNETWQSAFAPRDRRPTREWAGDHVILGPPLTKSGPFSTAGSRYLEAPIDDLDNDRVRQINIRAPVRGAKSLVVDIWIPELVARRPGPTMSVMAKDDMVEEHVTMRVIPMLKRCQPAAQYLPSDPRKITKGGIDFTHGMNLFFNGPSLTNAQNKPIQNMALDECWMYKAGTIGEFKGRLGDYEKQETSKLILASQGGIEDSDWDAEFNKGIIYTWAVSCMKCVKSFVPEWSITREDGSFAGMRWDEHKNDAGLWIVQRCLDSVRYECPHCGHPHTYTPRTMSEWDRRGEYLKEDDRDKNKSIHSYQYNAVVTRPWHLLVEQFLHAANAIKQGGYLPMVEFYQKRLAKNKSENSFILSRSATIRTMEYVTNEQWPEEKFRFMTVDCQKDFEDFWVVIRAWGEGLKSRLLTWKRCSSWAELEALQKEFNVPDVQVLVDVAYTHKTAISEVGKRNWTGLWGQDIALFSQPDGKRQVQLIYSQQKNTQEGGVYFFWARPTVADFFDQLKRGKVGDWSVDTGAGTTYSDHLNAQYKKAFTNPKTGVVSWRWALRKHGMDDHLLDCERMQLPGAAMAGMLDDTLFTAPEQPE